MPRAPRKRPAAKRRRPAARPVPSPVVALLTDFGSRDHYAGAVKGAILAGCPEATVVDISHEVPRHDVAAAAFSLSAAHRSFPLGTVFVAVVDPGVGSARRALAVEAGGWRFVGPDNGIFTLILAEHPKASVREIRNARFLPKEVSATFHGRDVFAPVAAHLACGGAVSDVGPAVRDPVVFPLEAVRRVGRSEWEAAVVDVDGFGNLTTNLSREDLAGILSTLGGDPTRIVVVVEGAVLPLVRTYADVAEGEPCALMGSSGRLEIAVHRDSAARLLGAPKGAPVRLRVAVFRG
jgi:S-adenosyl-L-methionine hydrolase (adenosine-forming)